MDDFRRQQTLALFIRKGIADPKMTARSRKRVIDQKALVKQSPARARSHPDAALRQSFPLLVCEQTVFFYPHRHNAVIRTQYITDLDIIRMRPVQTSDQHLVKGWRNRADPQAFQTGLQHTAEQLGSHLFLTRQFDKLIEQVHNTIPELSVLPGEHQISPHCIAAAPLLQPVRCTGILQQFVYCPAHLLHAHGSFQSPVEFSQRSRNSITALDNLLKCSLFCHARRAGRALQ